MFRNYIISMRNKHGFLLSVFFIVSLQILGIFLIYSYTTSKQLVTVEPNINYLIWKKIDFTENVLNDFNKLIDEYIALWEPAPNKIVTTRIYDTLEMKYYGAGCRVRVISGVVYYRHVYKWGDTTYPMYLRRLLFHLEIVTKAIKKYDIPDVEFFVGLADGPRAAIDTSAWVPGYPIFGLLGSKNHIDIPIPHPAEYGAHGAYTVRDSINVPWEARESKLYWRGASNCFIFESDNWHTCARTRLAKMKKQYPDILDVGVSRYAPRSELPREEYLNSTGTEIVEREDVGNQANYKYILDVDGSWGSSRKVGILECGSIMFAQDSPWFAYYQPLMIPYRHFVPIDRILRDLPQKVQWANDNPDFMQHIAEEGVKFHQQYASKEAAILYWSILLKKWAAISETPPGTDKVGWNPCGGPVPKSSLGMTPLGCSQGWKKYTKNNAIADYQPYDLKYSLSDFYDDINL
jgi:hypothetical protein